MAIRELDERHKTLAEELLKGTPRSKIAEKIGVDRTTLYAWMKDPIWQRYFEKLAQDLDEARSARLVVVVMKLADVVEGYLDYVLEALESGEPDRMREVPGLETLTTALKRVAELERADFRPAGTGPKRPADTPAAEARKQAAKDRLSRLLARTEETQH